MKKILLPLALILSLLLLACPVLAQNADDNNMENLKALYAQEPPLTANDISTFLAMAKDLKDVGSDEAKFLELLNEYKLTKERYGFMLSKITTGISLAMKVPKDSFKDMKELLPNDEEQKLIVENKDAIIEAIKQLGR